MLNLRLHWGKMPLMCRTFLLRRRAGVHPAISAVVTDAVDRRAVVDDGRVVDVMNHRDIHVGDGTVVEEVSMVPASAFETFSEIAEAVVDPAIEADQWAPITVVENEPSVAPRPVWRSPEEARFGSEDPCARYPIIVIVVVAPCPVPRRPDIAVAGTDRLLVDRESGRPERYRNSHLAE